MDNFGTGGGGINIAFIDLSGAGSGDPGPEQKEFMDEVSRDLRASLGKLKEVSFTGKVNAHTGKIELSFSGDTDDYTMAFISFMCQKRLAREVSRLWDVTYKWDNKRKLTAFDMISKKAFELEEKFAKLDAEKL